MHTWGGSLPIAGPYLYHTVPGTLYGIMVMLYSGTTVFLNPKPLDPKPLNP